MSDRRDTDANGALVAASDGGKPAGLTMRNTGAYPGIGGPPAVRAGTW
jgi:hypothetical protein